MEEGGVEEGVGGDHVVRLVGEEGEGEILQDPAQLHDHWWFVRLLLP